MIKDKFLISGRKSSNAPFKYLEPKYSLSSAIRRADKYIKRGYDGVCVIHNASNNEVYCRYSNGTKMVKRDGEVTIEFRSPTFELPPYLQSIVEQRRLEILNLISTQSET